MTCRQSWRSSPPFWASGGNWALPQAHCETSPLRSALTPFFFKPCLHWGFITETSTIKLAASTTKLPYNDWSCPHRGSDLGAQWEPSGLVTALERNSPVWDVELLPLCFLLKWKTDCAAEGTCSLCFVTARSNLNWTSKIRQREFSPAHPCILMVEGWKMKVESWEQQRQTLCLPAASRASVLSTSLTFPDPSHPAQPCQGLDSTMLLIRHKTTLFLSKGLGIKLRQVIYSNRNQGITWEYSHGRFLSRNRGWKEMQSHQLLLLLHHILSYSFDAPVRFLTLSPSLRLVIQYKMLKAAWKTVRHQADLPLSCFTALTSASAETEHQTPFLPTKPTFHPWGNSKYSYFIPQHGKHPNPLMQLQSDHNF